MELRRPLVQTNSRPPASGGQPGLQLRVHRGPLSANNQEFGMAGRSMSIEVARFR